MNTYKSPAKRGLRTFAQAAVAVLAVNAGALIVDAQDGSLDLAKWQTVGMMAIAAGVAGVIGWAHNALEEKPKGKV